MKRKFKKVLPTIIFISLSLIIVGILFLKNNGIEVNASEFTKGVAQEYRYFDTVGAKGSPTNPFLILEIVPDECFAEIGYAIAGCEPVDIKRLEIQDNIKRLDDFGGAEVSANKVTVKKFDLEIGDIPLQWTFDSTNTITHKGYYQLVSDGEGNYTQVKVRNGEDIIITYERTSSGNLIWVTDDSLDLSLLPDTQELINVGDRAYKERTDNYYWSNRYIYKNKNLFFKNVLMLEDDQIEDYCVIVKTISPADLNAKTEWIDRADLIYISTKSHSTELATLWNLYNVYGKPPRGTNVKFTDANDLSWDAVMKIFDKTVLNSQRAGLIFDNQILTTTSNYSYKNVTNYQITYDGLKSGHNNSMQRGYSNNLYKLGLMTQLMNPRVFYNLYLSNHESSTIPLVQTVVNTELSKQTGSCIIQNASADNQKAEELYWNAYTFLTSNKDGTRANNTVWNNMWSNGFRLNYNNLGTESLFGRILALDGNRSIINMLSDTNDFRNGRYTEALDDYSSNMGAAPTRSLAISYICSTISDAIEYKNSINVLELQPCSDYSLTDFRIRMLVPTFIGKVTITRQTTAEFNGKIEDLNSKYDLIYMGMNTGKLPINASTNKTDYNDNALDGYVYLHVGDKVTTNRYNERMRTWDFSTPIPTEKWVSVTTNPTRTVRFPGNDITDLKKKQLEQFLSANYPVLVHNDLYTIKHNVVDDTTYISKFIADNKWKTNLMDENSVATGLLESFIREVKPKIELITHPVQYNGTTDTGNISSDYYINGTGMSIDYRELKFTFRINDGGLNEFYNVKLYVDRNADGKYSDVECLNTSVRRAGSGQHLLTKKLGSEFVGAVPWMLQIVSQSNPNKRSEVTGIAAIKARETEKREVRVLQINQTSGSTLNLEENYNTYKNFRKYTEGLNDFKIIFKTVNTSQFMNWFNGVNAFDNTNAETRFYTDRLKDYDMIVFGFADMYNNIGSTNGALDNVFYFIEQGKSVLFTHDVTSYNTDPSNSTAFGYSFNTYFRDVLGMDRFGVRTSVKSVKDTKDKPTSPTGALYPEIQGYTYAAIKRMADNSQKMSFRGISFGDSNFHSTSVTNTNEGQITQYPYKINDTINVANTHSQYFQLDLEDPTLVVWYCLTGGTNNLYGVSPNDAANNYYIYNKGNITYSGVGHSAVNDSVMEVKLFVNTMIAAYKNTYSKPMVELSDPDAFLGRPMASYDRNYFYYINSDGDENSAVEFASGDKLYVTFSPIEYNLISGNLGVKVSYTKADSTEVICNVYRKSDDVLMSGGFPGNLGYVELISDELYYFEFDKSEFNNLNTEEISIQVVNSLGQNSNTLVRLLRRTLFKLK